MQDAIFPIAPSDSLGGLVVRYAGASRVLHHYQLDFCCGGRTDLGTACATKGLDVQSVIDEIAAETKADGGSERWDEAPVDQIIDHILATYHEPHRAELPRLIEMATKVERVHEAKPSCPHGLAAHLLSMATALENHMQKEEAVLFPLFRRGGGSHAHGPVQVMEAEHQDHAENLARLAELAHDFQPPTGACATWQALYLGLADLDLQIRRHIHLENNVLFPKALNS
jgi:regulator of cell morphogenesis and NO signaling